MVRTRWEGYGDPPTFQADNFWKVASSSDTVSWSSVLSERAFVGSTDGGRDHLRSRPPDRWKDHSSLDVIIGNSHLLRLATADRSSHPSRYVATYVPYASENLTKHWCSPRELTDDGDYLWSSGSFPRRGRIHGTISGPHPLLRQPGVWSRSNEGRYTAGEVFFRAIVISVGSPA